MAEKDYARLCCVECKSLFAPTLNLDGSLRKNQVSFCGEYCDGRAYRRARGANSWRTERACEHCKAAYLPKHPVAMYCSKACKHRAYMANSVANHALLTRLTRQRKDARLEAKAEVRDAVKARLVAKRQAAIARAVLARAVQEARWARPCAVCQSSMGKGRRKWCSRTCERQSPERQADKAIEKAKRRARSKTLPCERFSPLKIFERDGWQCQLCGCDTPKSKRGTYDDDAPELDHIMPLALGGHHTMNNTQCACRRCNGDKGATVQTGGGRVGFLPKTTPDRPRRADVMDSHNTP